MTSRRCLTPIVLLALWGCESRGLEPATDAALALQIGTAANFVSAADAGTVHIEGPTSRSLSIQPGETRTVEGLEPGQYNVALEALLAGRLESFGETSVTVTSGRVSQANITLRSFTPLFLDLEDEASRGAPFDVQFGAVSGAEGYLVEWDDDASFVSPESADASGPSTSITFSEQGIHYVRVIARGPYGKDGIPTEAETVDVVNRAPPTATILQPVANATFALGEEVTFEGSAEDLEDGTLTGVSLSWNSDVDGDLGTGTSLVVSDLSAGPHTITLTATDSDDAVGTDTRSITVEAGEPTVRIGETLSSTAAVGDQVILPIVLDLDQTGGAYDVAVLEILVGLSNVLLGAETWTVANGDFVFSNLERSTEGTTQFGRIGFSRDADFAQSATLGLLILDAAAVGTASVEIEIVTVSDPDGEPIGAGLFTEVPHELVIEEGQPTVQLLEPGTSLANLDGGVLYFRIPVGTVPGTVPGGPGSVHVEPSPAPGGRGRVHGTTPPAGVAAAGSRGPFEGSASLGDFGATSGYARLLRGLLSDRDTEVQKASGSAPGQTLRVQISGGTGDADLHVRQGQLPTPNEFDCRPFQEGNNEGCDAVDAPDGDWFVMIRPFGPAFAGVFLEAFLFQPVSIVTASLPGGAVGTPFQATLQAGEGDGTYSWSFVAGDLPPNVELSEDGTVSGTPTAAGDFTFTVQVVSAGKAAQAEFTITVVPSPAPLSWVPARGPPWRPTPPPRRTA